MGEQNQNEFTDTHDDFERLFVRRLLRRLPGRTRTTRSTYNVRDYYSGHSSTRQAPQYFKKQVKVRFRSRDVPQLSGNGREDTARKGNA
jgi:hypothetical protein